MTNSSNIFHIEQIALLPSIGKWLCMASVVAALASSAAAVFLMTLDHATAWREAHRWIIWLLPVAGFGVGMVYHLAGRSVERGNNLIIDEIHDPQKVIPLRMVPLVLGGTVVSHLFGASVGREGTAVQMGAALADQLTQLFRVTPEGRRVLLMAGMSAGFAAVFGTPLAGTIFGLEVLAIGRIRHDALLPCVVASLGADQVCLAWGVHHTHYAIGTIVPVGFWSVAAVIVAGIVFGLAGMAFAVSARRVGAAAKRWVAYAPLRPFVGGVAVALAVWLLGTDKYIGLGIPTIVDALRQPLPGQDFLAKMAFTIVSLGSGFKGGEVTPLFFIGATLGNALAPLLQQPFALLAAVGFVAVFAGAANAPLASTVMAMELFGPDIGVSAALACVTAYACSGRPGIYRAQSPTS